MSSLLGEDLRQALLEGSAGLSLEVWKLNGARGQERRVVRVLDDKITIVNAKKIVGRKKEYHAADLLSVTMCKSDVALTAKPAPQPSATPLPPGAPEPDKTNTSPAFFWSRRARRRPREVDHPRPPISFVDQTQGPATPDNAFVRMCFCNATVDVCGKDAAATAKLYEALLCIRGLKPHPVAKVASAIFFETEQQRPSDYAEADEPPPPPYEDIDVSASDLQDPNENPNKHLSGGRELSNSPPRAAPRLRARTSRGLNGVVSTKAGYSPAVEAFLGASQSASSYSGDAKNRASSRSKNGILSAKFSNNLSANNSFSTSKKSALVASSSSNAAAAATASAFLLQSNSAVPALPSGYVEPAALPQLVRLLTRPLAGSGGGGSGGGSGGVGGPKMHVTALLGSHALGKSVLAAAAATHAEVLGAFLGGVAWLRVGPGGIDSLQHLLEDLVDQFSSLQREDAPNFTKNEPYGTKRPHDARDAASLAAWLISRRNGRCLIVLDDVRDVNVVDVLQPLGASLLLVTSDANCRVNKLAGPEATVKMQALEAEAAAPFLRAAAGMRFPPPFAEAEVLQALAPAAPVLAVKLTGCVLRESTSEDEWRHAAERLELASPTPATAAAAPAAVQNTAASSASGSGSGAAFVAAAALGENRSDAGSGAAALFRTGGSVSSTSTVAAGAAVSAVAGGGGNAVEIAAAEAAAATSNTEKIKNAAGDTFFAPKFDHIAALRSRTSQNASLPHSRNLPLSHSDPSKASQLLVGLGVGTAAGTVLEGEESACADDSDETDGCFEFARKSELEMTPLLAATELALEQLPQAYRRCFAALAVLPAGVPVTLGLVGALWECELLEGRAMAEVMVSRGLLQRAAPGYVLLGGGESACAKVVAASLPAQLKTRAYTALASHLGSFETLSHYSSRDDLGTLRQLWKVCNEGALATSGRSHVSCAIYNQGLEALRNSLTKDQKRSSNRRPTTAQSRLDPEATETRLLQLLDLATAANLVARWSSSRRCGCPVVSLHFESAKMLEDAVAICEQQVRAAEAKRAPLSCHAAVLDSTTDSETGGSGRSFGYNPAPTARASVPRAPRSPVNTSNAQQQQQGNLLSEPQQQQQQQQQLGAPDGLFSSMDKGAGALLKTLRETLEALGTGTYNSTPSGANNSAEQDQNSDDDSIINPSKQQDNTPGTATPATSNVSGRATMTAAVSILLADEEEIDRRRADSDDAEWAPTDFDTSPEEVRLAQLRLALERVLGELGMELLDAGEAAKATKQCTRSLDMARNRLKLANAYRRKNDHPNDNLPEAAELVEPLYRLRRAYLMHEQVDEAVALTDELLVAQKTRWGIDAPPLEARVWEDLARSLQAQGLMTLAKEMYGRSLAACEAAYGPNHPLTAETLDSSTAIAVVTEDYAEAEMLLTRALRIRQEAACLSSVPALGDYDSTSAFSSVGGEGGNSARRNLPNTAVLRSLERLADLRMAQGRTTEAQHLLLECLQVRTALYGPKSFAVAATHHRLALLCLSTAMGGGGSGSEHSGGDGGTVRRQFLSVGSVSLDNIIDGNDFFKIPSSGYSSTGGSSDHMRRNSSFEPLENDVLHERSASTEQAGGRRLSVPSRERAVSADTAAAAAGTDPSVRVLARLHARIKDAAAAKRAVAHLRSCLEVYLVTIGSHHPRSCDVMGLLAQTLAQMGDTEASEAEHRRWLEALHSAPTAAAGSASAIGGAGFAAAEDYWPERLKDENCLDALNGLVTLLRRQRRESDAIELMREILLADERVYGKLSPQLTQDTLRLAQMYANVRCFSAAEPLLREVIHQRERLYGLEHVEAAQPMQALADLLIEQQEYRQAETLLRRALNIHRKALEQNDTTGAQARPGRPDSVPAALPKAFSPPLVSATTTMGSRAGSGSSSSSASQTTMLEVMRALGLVLSRQRRYEEAVPLYREILRMDEARLGPNSPEVITEMDVLAVLLHAQGKLDEAEPLMERVRELREKTYGMNDRSVADSLVNLAVLNNSRGKYSVALPMLRRAYDILEAKRGKGHPDTIACLGWLAETLLKQHQYSHAQTVLEKIVAIQEQELGSKDPTLADTLNDLADVLRLRQQLPNAEKLYLRALAIREERLGINHESVARCCLSLSLVTSDLGRPDEAEAYQRRAIAIRESGRGASHGKKTHRAAFAANKQQRVNPEAVMAPENCSDSDVRAERHARAAVERGISMAVLSGNKHGGNARKR